MMIRKSVEEFFKEGGDAFRAGQNRASNPYRDGENGRFDWNCGWDSAEASKNIAFQDYLKVRALRDKGYAPPGMPLHVIQQARDKKIGQLEADFPDFAEAFARGAR